jgi:hypothetical protein
LISLIDLFENINIDNTPNIQASMIVNKRELFMFYKFSKYDMIETQYAIWARWFLTSILFHSQLWLWDWCMDWESRNISYITIGSKWLYKEDLFFFVKKKKKICHLTDIFHHFEFSRLATNILLYNSIRHQITNPKTKTFHQADPNFHKFLCKKSTILNCSAILNF